MSEPGALVFYRWHCTHGKYTCEDCKGRDGRVMSMAQWISIGLPGTEGTRCGMHCRCYLEAVRMDETAGIWETIGGAPYWYFVFERIAGRLSPANSAKEIMRMRTEQTEKKVEQVTESENYMLGSKEFRERFSLGVLDQADQAGQFEILAITAGKGNGWDFGADVLQDSVPLWDMTECFLDHNLAARSVKDLAGVLSSPAWDESKQGIRATLKAIGPGGELLQELGKVVLSGGLPGKAVGFSADIIFTANKKKVEKVLKVLSVDLVIDPARGGQFIREMYQNRESVKMETEVKEKKPADSSDADALRTLLGVQQEQARLAEEAEKSKAIRVQMCEYLLSSGLAASKLPAPAAEQVRRQFAGKVFEPGDLTAAINDARKLVSDLTAHLVVSGPGRIHGMFTAEDSLQNAVDDLLGARRAQDKKAAQTARLSGIREL